MFAPLGGEGHIVARGVRRVHGLAVTPLPPLAYYPTGEKFHNTLLGYPTGGPPLPPLAYSPIGGEVRTFLIARDDSRELFPAPGGVALVPRSLGEVVRSDGEGCLL